MSKRMYLPQLTLSAHATIIFLTSRTMLTRTFVNPGSDPIAELRYTLPLYEGVSVVGLSVLSSTTGLCGEWSRSAAKLQDVIAKDRDGNVWELGQSVDIVQDQMPDVEEILEEALKGKISDELQASPLWNDRS
jgi:hypothetical protein